MLYKNIIGIITLGFMSLNAMNNQELMTIDCQVPHTLSHLNVVHDGNDFFVQDGSGLQRIHKYDIDPVLRKMNNKQLKAFQEIGYLTLRKIGHEYGIKSNVRGIGGGPLTGWAAYMATKTAGYAAYAASIYATGGEALIHHTEAMIAIETAAQAAAYVGTVAPTP